MTYSEALQYIHSINWTFTKPGLERIGALCEKLGNPQNELKFVHVAGTNGKGSFCTMLDSVLRAAGYKTGLFTSPYIKEFGERIRYCGENISCDDLSRITEYVKPIADAMEDKPTEFELITAIGLEYFKRKECDVVILEAGMGGRLDSTNIIESSLLSVITGIALDHTAYLGETVEKIAAEKAGIIKRGGSVLFGGDSESAADVIEQRAREQGAVYSRVDRSTLRVVSTDLCTTVFDYKGREGLELGMLGLYQPKNAAMVISALAAKGEAIDYAVDVDVPDENIINRMGGRRACVACGATYHIVHIPTKVEGVCDRCGESLILRDDDKPETVKKRLDVYHAQTQPLIDYYTSKNVLKTVDGTQDMEAVFQAIVDILGA